MNVIRTIQLVSYGNFDQHTSNEFTSRLTERSLGISETDRSQQQKLIVKKIEPSKKLPTFPSIEYETRSHVDTACAAFWLNRRNQTLRSWACLENGPIRPRRINGRLSWAVVDIKKLLGESP
jgi:hypothetical protein